MTTDPTRRFGVVLPVKRLSEAKTRLAPLGDGVRRQLVAAFALDTAAAALECADVALLLVVTDELSIADAVEELGAGAIPDGHPGDLNATLRQGAAEIVRRNPALRPVALCADLPAVDPRHLADALAAAAGVAGAAFVPDVTGSGTTMYTAPDLDTFRPRFGEGSRAAHLAAGAAEIAASPTLRQDVDTPAHLDAVRELGPGPRTAWVLSTMLPR